MTHVLPRGFVATLILVTGVSSPRLARAAGDCAAAYEDTQVARKAGHLLDARKSALVCASSACPRKMAAECSAWGAEIDRLTPSVILSFQRPDGSDAVGAVVTVDGQPTALDGRALPLDPGPHAVRVELDGFDPMELPLLVQEGEQRRRIAGTLVPKAAPPAAPPASRAPFVATVTIGSIAAALGTGFGVAALVQYEHLSSTCSPRCSPDDGATVRTRALVTDVSFGIAVVSFATAIALRYAPSKDPSKETRLSLAPARGGASLGFGGTF